MPAVVDTTQATKVSRREQRKITTRTDLLAAGRRLFSQKGLYESRIEDLTNSAGIAKGTLYQYFEDREDLIQAVVADGFHELQRYVRLRVHGTGSADRLVRELVEAHLDFLTENRDLMRIFHQVRGLLKFDQARWGRLRRALVGHLDFLSRLMASPDAFPRAAARRRKLVAALLFGSVSGFLSMQTSSDPKSLPQLDGPVVADALTTLVLRAMSGPKPAREHPM